MMKRMGFLRVGALLCGILIMFAGCGHTSTPLPGTEPGTGTGELVPAQTQECTQDCAHEWEDWICVRPAACTEEGLAVRNCKLCGNQENLRFPATWHHFVDGVCVDCGIFDDSEPLESEPHPEFALNPDGTSYTVTGIGSVTNGKLTIPATYRGKPVTGIGEDAFRKCTHLTAVVIPDGVTFIGDYAFQGCTALASVAIPEGVTDIGLSAFLGCTALKRVDLPDSLISIGAYAFTNCGNLTYITLGNHLKSIGSWAFMDCKALTELDIPEAVTEIGLYAFLGCDSLTRVTFSNPNGWKADTAELSLPDAITAATYLTGTYCGYEWTRTATSSGHVHMWEWSQVLAPTCTAKGFVSRACTVCEAYEEWHLPIREHRFVDDICANCGAKRGSEGLVFALNSDQSSYTVTGIGTCTDSVILIPSVHDGKPVTAIGKYAFALSKDLTGVVIPASVTDIEATAFAACDSLIDITVEEGNPVYHSAGNCIMETASKTLIAGCNASVIPLDGSVTAIGDDAFSARHSLRFLLIPDGITSIGDHAFEGCLSLTGIALPASLISIGERAFASCNAMMRMLVEGGNPVYHSAGNCIIETASKTLIAGCGASVIPADGSVTRIGDYAFYNCDSLISVSIPEGVTVIGNFAFAECGNLTAVSLPGSLTSIGVAAFSNCKSLKGLVIPESVTHIGSSAFFGCDGLEELAAPVGSQTDVG